MTLRVLDAVAYGRMCCAQLRSAQMIAKKMQMTRQRDRETDREMEIQTDRHIISTGPHWGPEDPSVGISSSLRGRRLNHRCIDTQSA